MALNRKIVAFHRRLSDPRQRGAGIALCRALLRPASLGYGAAVCLRNRAYDRGWKGVHRAAVPVISVGNITAGGTGKTPFTAWLTEVLLRRGLRPAILSRGYGRQRRSGLDDENQLLSTLACGVPIVVDPDRVRGASRAVAVHGAEVLVLDDGFQHRRLARDLDIVLVDALNPFGAGSAPRAGAGLPDSALPPPGGHLLPRGLLREPPSALGRADFVVLTRSDQVPQPYIEGLRESLARHGAQPPPALAVHRPVGLRRVGEAPPRVIRRGKGEEPGPALEDLSKGRWGGFCGLGNPEAFRLTLEGLGAELASFAAFPDHHRYRADELASLLEEARQAGCRAVVTTEKDAIKLEALLSPTPPIPVLALQVRMEVAEGRSELERLIASAL